MGKTFKDSGITYENYKYISIRVTKLANCVWGMAYYSKPWYGVNYLWKDKFKNFNNIY